MESRGHVLPKALTSHRYGVSKGEPGYESSLDCLYAKSRALVVNLKLLAFWMFTWPDESAKSRQSVPRQQIMPAKSIAKGKAKAEPKVRMAELAPAENNWVRPTKWEDAGIDTTRLFVVKQCDSVWDFTGLGRCVQPKKKNPLKRMYWVMMCEARRVGAATIVGKPGRTPWESTEPTSRYMELDGVQMNRLFKLVSMDPRDVSEKVKDGYPVPPDALAL